MIWGEIPWTDEEFKGFRQREHLALKLGCVSGREVRDGAMTASGQGHGYHAPLSCQGGCTSFIENVQLVKTFKGG